MSRPLLIHGPLNGVCILFTKAWYIHEAGLPIPRNMYCKRAHAGGTRVTVKPKEDMYHTGKPLRPVPRLNAAAGATQPYEPHLASQTPT